VNRSVMTTMMLGTGLIGEIMGTLASDAMEMA
jgi:hypothetical protein